jgi:hypothetical protein
MTTKLEIVRLVYPFGNSSSNPSVQQTHVLFFWIPKGRKGQAAKQERDRERALDRGEISEDEPTYYAQGRARGPGNDDDRPQNPRDMVSKHSLRKMLIRGSCFDHLSLHHRNTCGC